MYRWRDKFTADDLEVADDLSSKLVSITEDENVISAKVGDDKSYNVRIVLDDKHVKDFTCTCDNTNPCCHIASLLYYVENNFKDFKSLAFYDDEIKNIVYNINEDSLRDFVFNELMVDEDLKEKFCNIYSDNNLVDRGHYYSKLDYVLECGEGGDFRYHHIYDLDVIGGLLYDFIFEDVQSLIRLGEDVFASELLNKCAFLLQEDVTRDDEWWYDCAEIYSECADIILYRNEDNDDKVFYELEANSDDIRRRGL